MRDFQLLLPGRSLEEVRFAAVHGASDPARAVDVSVDGTAITAKVLVERSTQPELRGTLRGVPEGTLVEGRLHYAAPLAYVAAYGLMTLAAAGFAASLARREEWVATAIVAGAALFLLVMTWLSLHAGVAHQDDDVDWLQRELSAYLSPQLS